VIEKNSWLKVLNESRATINTTCSEKIRSEAVSYAPKDAY